MNNKPIIGISMGDAAGIGPEIICKALNKQYIYDICKPVVIGNVNVLKYALDVCAINNDIKAITSIEEGGHRFGTIDVFDGENIDFKFKEDDIGKTVAQYGDAAVRYTVQAGTLALNNKIHAMVSAPLNKESMRLAGYNYEGQTQILGELTGVKNYGMILILNEIRIMMYSNHLSLEDACKSVKNEKILEKIILANKGLDYFDLENRRIGIAGLNPHSGENGLFGRQEIDEMIPAIKAAQKMGINVDGPIPGDVIFTKAIHGEYDLVLSMYHDQACLALKLIGFGEVVTLLAGLPIIRTSTGHGTAFDIAYKNIADEKNLIRAIELAAKLAMKKLKRSLL